MSGVVSAAVKDEGLVFRLSEGVEDAAPAAQAATGAAEPLTEQETQKVLDRLPAMTPEPGQERDFALRDKSLPPPRTGPAAALEVLRHAPDGDVPLAPNLSVTFSQPMVAVTSQEEAAQTVRLEDMYLYGVKQNGRQYYGVTYGNYSTLEDTITAMGDLPMSFKSRGPFHRSIGVMRRQNQE
jgi:septal ring-binding cell division protein DamX